MTRKDWRDDWNWTDGLSATDPSSQLSGSILSGTDPLSQLSGEDLISYGGNWRNWPPKPPSSHAPLLHIERKSWPKEYIQWVEETTDPMDCLLAWTEEDKREVLRDEAAEIADAETGSAHGVEDMDTAQQISRLPPGQKGLKRKSSQKRKKYLGKRKRSQKQSTRRMRQNDANAGNTVGGSRLVLNKSIKSYAGRNDCFAERKCLPDAIIALLDEGTKKQGGELYAVMPKERDTSPNDLKDALSRLGLCLKRVTREYKKVDCLPSYLLLKEEKCKLVIHVNLTDADGNAISHFIAWDGTTVFDHPFNLRINKTTDRMSESNSQQAFEKLFTRSYLVWNITSVFRLCIDNRPSV